MRSSDSIVRRMSTERGFARSIEPTSSSLRSGKESLRTSKLCSSSTTPFSSTRRPTKPRTGASGKPSRFRPARKPDVVETVSVHAVARTVSYDMRLGGAPTESESNRFSAKALAVEEHMGRQTTRQALDSLVDPSTSASHGLEPKSATLIDPHGHVADKRREHAQDACLRRGGIDQRRAAGTRKPYQAEKRPQILQRGRLALQEARIPRRFPARGSS